LPYIFLYGEGKDAGLTFTNSPAPPPAWGGVVTLALCPTTVNHTQI
jgi:hypothetical protein